MLANEGSARCFGADGRGTRAAGCPPRSAQWDREGIASGNAAESRQATSGSPADRRGGTDNS